jgi:hypothetical protein
MSTKSRSLNVKKRTALDFPRLSMFFCEKHAKISMSLSVKNAPNKKSTHSQPSKKKSKC